MSNGTLPRIFIDGQAGTTGLEIAARLSAREDLALLEVDPAQRKEPAARRDLMASADLTILCLPDAAATEAAALAPAGTRLLDASSVHRTQADWVYGLPELGDAQRKAIGSAPRVSNPGCYPQGLILLLRPLLAAEVLDRGQPRVYQAVSGYSGGGRTMIERYEADTEGWLKATRSYGLDLKHKHRAEMHRYSSLQHAPVFLPSVGPYRQGMLGHLPIVARECATLQSVDSLTTLLREYYESEPLVKVLDGATEDPREAGFLDPTITNGTDRIELMVFGNDEQFVLCARYDNLGKGAAGAAVQNLNLMLGLGETAGLTL